MVSVFAKLTAINMASEKCKTLGQIKVVNVAYAWKIQDFFKHYENAEVVKPPIFESPVFSAETDARLKWRLRLTASDEDPRFLSVHLQLVSSGSYCEVCAKFRLSVFDRLNEHRYKYLGEYLFAEDDIAKVSTFVNGYTLVSEKDDVLPDGALTIMCLINTDLRFSSGNKFDDRPRVADDMRDLLTDKTYSDLKFTVLGKEFHAHKCVLAVRCPLLLHVLEERIERTGTRCTFNPPTELTEMEPVVMEEALRFIYTGRVEDIYENASNLLVFADKYDLPKLKEMCEKAMIDSVDCTTAAYYLVIADAKNAPGLRKAAIKFIVTHRADVLNTPAFKFLQENRKDLVEEIFRTAVLKNKIVL